MNDAPHIYDPVNTLNGRCGVCGQIGAECDGVRVGERVNHPAHYNLHPSGIECIRIVRHFNFNVGNVIKYLWRAGLKEKGATLEDHRNALFYLQDEIARLVAIEAARGDAAPEQTAGLVAYHVYDYDVANDKCRHCNLLPRQHLPISIVLHTDDVPPPGATFYCESCQQNYLESFNDHVCNRNLKK